MKRLGSRRARWMGGLMAVGMTLASFLANSVQTEQEKEKVAKMTDRMKTVCVGRFLIDLPADAHVSIGRGFVGGLDVSSTDSESDAEFATQLDAAEKELTTGLNRDGRPSLEASKALRFDAAQGKIFVYNRRRTRIPEGDRIETSESVSVRGMLRFSGLSIDASADWVSPENVGPVVDLLRRFRPRLGEDIPHESGFCLDHAIVLDPYEHRGTESVVMFAGLPGHPDVNIAFSTMAGTAPAPGLLERNAKAAERESAITRLAFTHLRERVRAINGLSGEELVMRVREPNFTTGYAFQWEMPGKQDDIHAPLITLELESGTNPVSGGKPVQSTLSEEAMFHLWERIVSSIRVRPTRSTKAAGPSPVVVALGASALAGEICPESGWWQCGGGGRGIGVFGGERRFLRKGQRMPQALLLPPATLWQRLRGMQPSYESSDPTLWTLADKRTSARIAPAAGLAQALLGMDGGIAPTGLSPGANLQAPLGSIAKTGAACPASGWWRCEDSHALDGTRWFAAGSVLPAATFRAQVHGRGVGHPELIHRRSAWQLVRHAGRSTEEEAAGLQAVVPSQSASRAV